MLSWIAGCNSENLVARHHGMALPLGGSDGGNCNIFANSDTSRTMAEDRRRQHGCHVGLGATKTMSAMAEIELPFIVRADISLKTSVFVFSMHVIA